MFDLQKDAYEMTNAYGLPGTEKITASLKAELKQLMQEYKDQEALKILAGAKK